MLAVRWVTQPAQAMTEQSPSTESRHLIPPIPSAPDHEVMGCSLLLCEKFYSNTPIARLGETAHGGPGVIAGVFNQLHLGLGGLVNDGLPIPPFWLYYRIQAMKPQKVVLNFFARVLAINGIADGGGMPVAGVETDIDEKNQFSSEGGLPLYSAGLTVIKKKDGRPIHSHGVNNVSMRLEAWCSGTLLNTVLFQINYTLPDEVKS